MVSTEPLKNSWFKKLIFTVEKTHFDTFKGFSYCSYLHQKSQPCNVAFLQLYAEIRNLFTVG